MNSSKFTNNQIKTRGDKDVIHIIMAALTAFSNKVYLPQTRSTLNHYIKTFQCDIKRSQIQFTMPADKIFWIIIYLNYHFGQTTTGQIINYLIKKTIQLIQKQEKHDNQTFKRKKKAKLEMYLMGFKLLKENLSEANIKSAMQGIYKKKKTIIDRLNLMQTYFYPWSLQEMTEPKKNVGQKPIERQRLFIFQQTDEKQNQNEQIDLFENQKIFQMQQLSEEQFWQKQFQMQQLLRNNEQQSLKEQEQVDNQLSGTIVSNFGCESYNGGQEDIFYDLQEP